MSILEIAVKVLSAMGVVAAVYNIFSSRKIVQEQGQRAKIEQALSLGLENKKDIQHLKESAQMRADATEKRLDQIGEDTSWMRDMFTKWLLDPKRKS